VLHPIEGLDHEEGPFGQRKMHGVIAEKSDIFVWIQSGRFYGTSALCAGDSGASILAYHDEVPLVMGIASSSAEHFGLCLNGSVATRVSTYLSWIAAQMNAWLLAPPVMVSCCGNGVIEAPETCDDGNLDPLDACSNACETARCGDTMIQRDELCDGDCPVACDDGDPCTVDRLVGAGTCQARCSSVHEKSLCPAQIPGCTMFDAGLIFWPVLLMMLRRRRMA
jgi:cysteine-rich repeat protein